LRINVRAQNKLSRRIIKIIGLSLITLDIWSCVDPFTDRRSFHFDLNRSRRSPVSTTQWFVHSPPQRILSRTTRRVVCTIGRAARTTVGRSDHLGLAHTLRPVRSVGSSIRSGQSTRPAHCSGLCRIWNVSFPYSSSRVYTGRSRSDDTVAARQRVETRSKV